MNVKNCQEQKTEEKVKKFMSEKIALKCQFIVATPKK